MKTIRLCPGCGSPLTGDAVGGLCPACLLKTHVAAEGDLMDAPQAVPVPGEQFGDYRIVKLLGHGGMGEVYEAEQITSGRRVALKVMRHTLATEQDRKRFLREGRLAASVNHPNVVYVHGSEEISGAPAIAMELVHGGTLKDRLKREGPLPIAEAVEGALQIIDGLEAAHAAGVLHRDIKPANCFIAADGSVKVGDFGLSVSTLARGESLITASGAVMGTPAYASPEQLRGEELDVTSDIYSVGATSYHLLTGKTPFNATDFVKLITEVLDKVPVAPKTLREEIPAELSKILLRCLAKKRTERFESYAELRDALLPFRAKEMMPAKPAMRFLASLMDDFLIAYAPSLLYIMYWATDPLDTLMHQQTWRAALLCLPFYLWYLGYYAVTEGIWGAGLGKMTAGLRVVRRDGQLAGIPRAALRAAVWSIPIILPPLLVMVFMSPGAVSKADANDLLPTDWAWIPLTLLLFITMRARNGYAALQDLLSGTRVIVRPKTQTRPAVATVAIETTSSSLAHVGPYEVTGTLWKNNGEELLLALDPALRRKIWIHFLAADATPVPAARRDLSRATRLRWINSGECEGRSWDAYEALEGSPFLAVTQAQQPWKAVRFWLLDVAEECAISLTSPETAPALALEQLWITPAGRAVLLDFVAPGTKGTAKTSFAKPLGNESIQQFLTEISRRALEGGGNNSVRTLVPLHARSFLENLARGSFDEARFIVGNLQSLIAKPAEITRAHRAASLAFGLGIALGFAGLIVAVFNFDRLRWDRGWVATFPGQPSLRIATEIYDDKATAFGHDAEDSKDLVLAGTYIAQHFAALNTNEAFWAAHPAPVVQPNMREYLRQSVELYSTASAEQIAEAERAMAKRVAKRERAQGFGYLWVGFGMILVIVAIAALVDFVGAAAFRVLPVLNIFGFAVTDRRGERASRGRLLARSLCVWVPAVSVAFALTAIARNVSYGKAGDAIGVQLLLGLALVLMTDALIIYAVLRPTGGVQDRLAGTRLVPV
jgi:eukaryotic-like serine/threonine-protein kinase